MFALAKTPGMVKLTSHDFTVIPSCDPALCLPCGRWFGVLFL